MFNKRKDVIKQQTKVQGIAGFQLKFQFQFFNKRNH